MTTLNMRSVCTSATAVMLLAFAAAPADAQGQGHGGGHAHAAAPGGGMHQGAGPGPGAGHVARAPMAAPHGAPGYPSQRYGGAPSHLPPAAGAPGSGYSAPTGHNPFSSVAGGHPGSPGYGSPAPGGHPGGHGGGPPPGGFYHGPPPGYRVFNHYGTPYYYAGGYWYRPFGPYYYVVAPPLGLWVSFLPGFYTTLWFGGMPYYYANDVYYVAQPGGGYVVTDPPQGTPDRVDSTATGSDDVFVYPRNGQSPDQQSRDRYECHRWAVDQTGFDPTVAQGGVPAGQNESKRSDYMRALGACLDARGYTVR